VAHLLEKKNANFEDCLNFKTKEFEKERVKFQAKLNKFFTHSKLSAYLDDGSVDYRVLDFFELLIKNKYDGLLYIGNPIGQVLLENSVIQALMDVNILYLRKYFSYLHLAKRSYVYYVEDYIKEQKANMTLKQKLEYRAYRLKYGLELGDLKTSKLQYYEGLLEDSKLHLEHEITVYHPKKTPDVFMTESPLVYWWALI